MEKFFTVLMGKTLESHVKMNNRLTSEGLTEVWSPTKCDFIMLFCVPVCGLETDIKKALQDIPGSYSDL